MENKAKYFLVGLFVFGVFFVSLIVMIWLGDLGEKEESFDYYEIHTQESVSGLSVKAPVKLLGVQIGSVENIDILTDGQKLGVKILIKVKKNTPIKEDTTATLNLQGITGLKFIELQGGSKESKMLKQDEKNIPQIQFKESFLSTLSDEAERLGKFVETADEKLGRLLSADNLANIEFILQNLALFTQNSKELNESFLRASQNLALMADDVSKTARNFSVSLKYINQSSLAVENFAQEATKKFESYDALYYNLSQDLKLLSILLENSNRVLENLGKSPSDLIFKQTIPQKGPGES